MLRIFLFYFCFFGLLFGQVELLPLRVSADVDLVVPSATFGVGAVATTSFRVGTALSVDEVLIEDVEADVDVDVDVDVDSGALLDVAVFEDAESAEVLLQDPEFEEGVTESSILTEIEGRFDGVFQLFSPVENQLLVNNALVVKGVNKALTPVFIGDKPVELREDGRFYEDLTFDDYGKMMISVTYTTPEFQPYSLHQKILHLSSPDDLGEFPDDQQLYVYAYNTSYLYNPSRNRLLADDVTRADLAYFIAAVKGMPVDQQVFVPSGNVHWGDLYLRAAVQTGVMSEFPDGSLRPDAPITRGEYLMSMVRALELEMDYSESSLPYKDFDANHWTSKFIRTARSHQLLPMTGRIGFDEVLSVADFFKLMILVPQVSEAVETLLDFSVGYALDPAFEAEQLPSILTQILAYREQLDQVKRLSLSYPKTGDVFFKRQLFVEGRIFPSEQFRLNEVLITPDVDGSFIQEVSLNYGANELRFAYFDEEETVTVFALDPYPDLNRHWISDQAAALTFAGVIERTPSFNPKQRLSRGLFSGLMVTAFDLQSTANLRVTANDIVAEDPEYQAIETLLKLEIMTLDKKDNFYPERQIRKVEALIAILRAEGISIEKQKGKLSFKDMKKSHWAYNAVSTAVSVGLVSDAPYFFPNKPLTKAEFAALLYRVPSIKKRLTEVFTNDQTPSE